ncbi:MAG: hypothetical protein ACRDQA_24125 [Nocardioidaceae bacterium]
MADDGRADGLSPKPDPDSGLPRPPEAPRYLNLPPEERRNRLTDEQHKPSPPPGQGPVLAWYKSNQRGALKNGLVMVAILIVGFGIISLVRDSGLYMLGTWLIWLIIVVGGFGYYLLSLQPWTAAGAEWVRRNRSWVRTYELTTINTYFYLQKQRLHLCDSGGRTLRTNLLVLQEDELVWDLLYNGMLHSVVNGADISDATRGVLEIPDIDTLCQPRQSGAGREARVAEQMERLRRREEAPAHGLSDGSDDSPVDDEQERLW